MLDTAEQRKAATKRLRTRFLEIKRDFEYKDVRQPEIGALLDLLVDQELRIENLEAAIGNAGNAPALATPHS